MPFMDDIVRRMEAMGPLGEGERDALRIMEGMAEQFTLRKGEHLYHQGEVPDLVAFVHQGMLRHMVLDTDGNERIIRFHREGDLIQDCERWAANEPADHSIQAIEQCRVTVFRLAEVHALTDGHPGFDAIGARMMMGERNTLMDHVTMLQRYDPVDRYRHILSNDPDLVRRVSVTHLAQYLGLTRETLSRVRARVGEQVIS